MKLNRRQFLQGSILTTLFLWLRVKFPQLAQADDGSTPLPACLPFCLTSGQTQLVSTTVPVRPIDDGLFVRSKGARRETKTGRGAVVRIPRRGLFTWFKSK